jgi:RNA polymerase sigma-70 factor (ECF subfamily)
MRDVSGAIYQPAERYGALREDLPGDLSPTSKNGSTESTPPVEAGMWRTETAATRVARLYRDLFPAVFGFVRFRVGDTHLAEDLTAIVFERALAKLATVREPERVRAWLFTIARNAVVDERRRRRPDADLGAADQVEHLWVDSPEREVLDRDEWRRLVGYLAELDDRDREILGLRFAAGLTNREVGEIVRLSESNVAQIVHRAVVKLRRRFAHEETSR